MGDRERTDRSGTRWCEVYSRTTVHQVAVANVLANEWVPGETENVWYSTEGSRKPATRVPFYETTLKEIIKKQNKTKYSK